jgi:hypothetical protein
MANTRYKVLKGIDYPPNKRAEIGATVSDLPKESIPWLLASGVIVEDGKTKDASPITSAPKVVIDTKDAIGDDVAI